MIGVAIAMTEGQNASTVARVDIGLANVLTEIGKIDATTVESVGISNETVVTAQKAVLLLSRLVGAGVAAAAEVVTAEVAVAANEVAADEVAAAVVAAEAIAGVNPTVAAEAAAGTADAVKIRRRNPVIRTMSLIKMTRIGGARMMKKATEMRMRGRKTTK